MDMMNGRHTKEHTSVQLYVVGDINEFVCIMSNLKIRMPLYKLPLSRQLINA